VTTHNTKSKKLINFKKYIGKIIYIYIYIIVPLSFRRLIGLEPIAMSDK